MLEWFKNSKIRSLFRTLCSCILGAKVPRQFGFNLTTKKHKGLLKMNLLAASPFKIKQMWHLKKYRNLKLLLKMLTVDEELQNMSIFLFLVSFWRVQEWWSQVCNQKKTRNKQHTLKSGQISSRFITVCTVGCIESGANTNKSKQ